MLYSRPFKDYASYVQAQGGKATYARDKLLATTKQRTASFKRIFVDNRTRLNPGSILCLGARTGCEVHGALQAGFVGSIGIDLFPVQEGELNPVVVKADWHDIPFPDGTFDNAFTNALDHCLDLNKMLSEVHRVLRSGGIFMLADPGAINKKTAKEWLAHGGNEGLFWEDPSDLTSACELLGFVTDHVAASQGRWKFLFMRCCK